MQVQPYLFFNGRCEEAAEFYRRAIGAEILFSMRFKESPDAPPPGVKVDPNHMMHMTLKFGDTIVMASDGACEEGKSNFQGFSLSLSVKTTAEADRFFNALAQGGQVRMPLTQTFWSPRFGMLSDKFGIGWMVMTEAAQSTTGS